MRRLFFAKWLPTLLVAALLPLRPMQAQVADSVDVIDYDISLDLANGSPFAADATLKVRLLDDCQSLSLKLYGTVDSIWVDGIHQPDATLTAIPLGNSTVGDTALIRIKYQGSGHVEKGGDYNFGGFHFDNNLHYNLGCAFNENPHPIGRAVFPSRDNFHDKSTYTLRIHSAKDWTAECSGTLLQREALDDGTESTIWRIDQPVSSYLVGIGHAEWKRIESEVHSLYATYPLTLGYLSMDSTRVRNAFAELDSVVPMFERCLGPYRWGRIGYITTKYGSMEHVNNIALVRNAVQTYSEQGQMTIAHELGHSWFGNLVTCSTEKDMWFNEGGASFCSELAMEANAGRQEADRYYQNQLESVLRTTHVSDNGYRALSGMPHKYTYGSTTYDKGELVWHSLRGYLGDSLFYYSVRKLLDDKAFGTVDAYEVRDSLSKYSGVDLGDFFAFHVFSPGFADFHAELITCYAEDANARVRIRQQGVGTANLANSNRVPVTIFGHNGEQQRVVAAFDGDVYELDVALSFEPSYCVLDYGHELSDAATLEVLQKGTPLKGRVTHFGLEDTLSEGVQAIVEHHWGMPWDTDTLAHIHRTAHRYWVLRGPAGQPLGVKGHFFYERNGYSGGSFPYLDKDFYSNISALDSMAVLYREGEGFDWKVVSHQHEGNAHAGYFVVDNVLPGEYTLAVADLSLLGIDTASTQTLTLFPNPIHHGHAILLEAPTSEPFNVRIYDAQGRLMWQRKGCHNGQSIRPRLATGTYLVRIENKFVSLQSKLIVL